MPPTFSNTSPEDRVLLTMLATERGPRLKAVPLSLAALEELKAAKLVALSGGRWRLTAAGRERATAIASGATRPTEPRRTPNPCTLIARG